MKIILFLICTLSVAAHASTILNFSNYVFPGFEYTLKHGQNPYYIERTITISNGSVVMDSIWTSSDDETITSEEFQTSNDYCEIRVTYTSETGFPLGKVSVPSASYPLILNLPNHFWGTGKIKPGEPENMFSSLFEGQLTDTTTCGPVVTSFIYKKTFDESYQSGQVFMPRLTCFTHGKLKNYEDHYSKKVIQKAFGASLIVNQE